MSKQSKRNQRAMASSGMGGGQSVVYRFPKEAGRSPRVVELDAKMRSRLQCLEHAARTSVAEAAQVFGVSPSTVYRWRKQYHPDDLRTLQEKSRRPKRTRKVQWSAAAEQAVLAAREAQPRWGKAKVRIVLLAQGVALSESTIGRILQSLKKRGLLREPLAMRQKHRKPQRPYAVRLPKELRQSTVPGALIQLDTMHLCPVPGTQRRQFTAIDVVSRVAVVSVRSCATAGTAADFLDEMIARFPFPVQAIQVDGGSEYMGEFEVACQQRGILLYVLPPRSPKLNGRVERLNGTSRREFWECYDDDLVLPTLTKALRKWEEAYNSSRPHQALAYQTPLAYLASLTPPASFSYVSN